MSVNFNESAEFKCEVSEADAKGKWFKDGKEVTASDSRVQNFFENFAIFFDIFFFEKITAFWNPISQNTNHRTRMLAKIGYR